MAEHEISSSNVEIENNSDPELKYLAMVREIAIKILALLSVFYDYVKQNAGLFKSVIVDVESDVLATGRPADRKFKGVPDDLLAFADKKVDDAINMFDKHAPFLAKTIVTKTRSLVHNTILPLANYSLSIIHSIIQKSLQLAKDFIKEARAAGMCSALRSTLTTFKPMAITELAKLWNAANKIALFHELAQVVLPIAAYFSTKYNKVVEDCVVFTFLPLVPVEEMANAYNMVRATKEGPTEIAMEGVTKKSNELISNYFD